MPTLEIGNVGCHSYQKVNYHYIIRGKFAAINDMDYLSATIQKKDFFVFKMNYFEVQSIAMCSGKKLFKSNVSETYCCTNLDNVT